MMPKIHRSDTRKAQAMVEFALVLPILLLLLFGIFAFGHLFFTYSLVVASSREAARYGAAVGLSDNNLPRYRDCNAIRASAVRVGNIAGVNATDITVQYDGGVRVDGTTPVIYPHDCPINGIGPGYIELGDRIVVHVTVNYRPIVPLINFDEFPLVAETRRTIIIGMPVGDVTPSARLCTGTITRILPVNRDSFDGILVGEHFSAQLEVISDDPAIPAQGLVSLYVDDPTYSNPVCSGSASSVVNCSLAPILWEPAFYDINQPPVLRARYDPGAHVSPANPCFNPSLAEPQAVTLDPAFTTITINSIEVISTPDGDMARVSVSVVVNPPGGGIPTGSVSISDDYGNSCALVLTEPYASGYCDLRLNVYAPHTYTAVYNPAGDPNINPNYHSSTASQRIAFNTPTPSPTPTIITPDVTLVLNTAEPSATPTPGRVLNRLHSTPVPPGK